MTLTPHKLMTALRGVGIAVAIAALIALTGPFKYKDLGLPFPDTVAHGILFYGLAVLLIGALPRSRTFDLGWMLLVLGVATEIAQAIIGREASFKDFAGDAAGIAAAIAPTYLAQLRALVRTHPHTSFAELKTLDRRQGPRGRPVSPAAPETLAAR